MTAATFRWAVMIAVKILIVGGLFLLSGLIAFALRARGRQQAEALRRQAADTAQLHAFSRKVAGVRNLDELIWAACYHVARVTGGPAVIVLAQGEALEVGGGYPPEAVLPWEDLQAVERLRRDLEAGQEAGVPRLGVDWQFLPLRTARNMLGAVGITASAWLDAERLRLLTALADQTAVAVERVSLVEEIEGARFQAETERLRAAVLASISHDLRTPLASIIGAITSLRTYGETYDPPAREVLMATIQEEAERLNRFVGNLLDMTRIEAGALRFRLVPTEVADVVNGALRRCSRVLSDRSIQLDLPQALPLIQADHMLLEQILVNLLDNAAKYSPHGSPVRVSATLAGAQVEIRVADEGEGIPPDALERVFDQFYRARARDRQRAGTGLGLAICRGFAEAMGGRITAHNRQGGPGAVLTVILPAQVSY